jgi:hypothetical protein
MNTGAYLIIHCAMLTVTVLAVMMRLDAIVHRISFGANLMVDAFPITTGVMVIATVMAAVMNRIVIARRMVWVCHVGTAVVTILMNNVTA